jgi:hypothetical protein
MRDGEVFEELLLFIITQFISLREEIRIKRELLE